MKDSIARAVQVWKNGDHDGAIDLDRRVRAELLALVRRNRNSALRPRIDSEGVVNAALKSFLSGVRNDEFSTVQNRRDVERLLTRFTLCVLKDQIREALADKRTIAREQTMDAQGAPQPADASQPTAQECAMAVEYWEKFPEVVRGVHKNAMDVLELSLEGLTATQIADKTGMGVRTVQKIIRRMIEAWNRWLETESGDGRPGEPSA